jgi:membrane protein
MAKDGDKPGIISQFSSEFSKDDLSTQAAALSFYTTLALAPSLLLVLTLLGTLAPSAQERVIEQLVELGGAQIEPFVRTLIDSADDQPDLRQVAGWVSFLLLLVSASALFAQLQSAMNRIWDAEDAHLAGVWGLVRRRLLSVGMLMTLVFVSIVTLLAQAALTFLPQGEEGVWLVVGWIISVAVYTVLFAALYRYLPDRRVPWSTAFRGGAITAVLFMVGRAAIGAYLAYSDVAGAFGAAGSVIIWLLWAYYIGLVFLASAELVHILAERRGWAWFDDDGKGTTAGPRHRHEIPG